MTAIIAAYTKKSRVIGKNGTIPWNLPDDMRHFKQLTTGNAVILGRKTFESIGKPLSERLNIIVSRTKTFTAENCLTVRSLAEALQAGQNRNYTNSFICGGEQLYTQALPYCDRLYLTEIEAEYDGDAFFPPLDETCYDIVETERHPLFTYRTLVRRI